MDAHAHARDRAHAHSQLVFGGEEPVVVAGGHLGEDGCDESTSTTLLYSGGRTATLVTHSRYLLATKVSRGNTYFSHGQR